MCENSHSSRGGGRVLVVADREIGVGKYTSDLLLDQRLPEEPGHLPGRIPEGPAAEGALWQGVAEEKAIEPLTPENWVALLFTALGFFFLQKAARRSAVRSWGWGRTGDGAPLSRSSYALWGATFIVIGVGILRDPRPSSFSVTLFFACFIALGISGFMDTRAERRRQWSEQRMSGDQP